MERDAPHGGLLVLGADNDHLPCEGGTITSPTHCSGKAFGALAAVLESGMDNSPMYDNAFDQQPATYNATTGRLELYDVQMSSLFVSESHALQKLASVAGELGHTALSVLQRQAKEMASRINVSLWDEQTGIFRQRYADVSLLMF